MRTRTRILLPLLVLAGCRGADVAPPEMRRPLEALPAGARTLLLTSDLQNSWDRLEAHDVGRLVEKLQPAGHVLERPEVVQLRARLREFESRSGVKVRQDLILNALGGRAGVAVYPREGGGSDWLLAGELRDAGRFRAALLSLQKEPGDSVRVRFADASLDGKPALRISGDEGPELLLVQQERLLVVSTRDDLVRRALAVQAGQEPSVLHDPAYTAALAAVGMHNVVVLSRDTGSENMQWVADGFTWDRTGLHFEHLASEPAGSVTTPGSGTHRDEILRSIPDGVTFACYSQSLDPSLWRGLHGSAAPGGDAADPRSSIAGGSASSAAFPMPLDFQRDVLPWAQGEIGIALLGVRVTTLAPVPDLAALLAVRDAERARASLGQLEHSLASLVPGGGESGFVEVRYGGRTFRSLGQPLLEALSPSYMLDGDLLVVTVTRDFMQQIIDTRRAGKRHLLTDASFRPFESFVPPDAQAVCYADQHRLNRALQQANQSAVRWGQGVSRPLEQVQSWSVLLEHFPAGAAYVARSGDRVTVRGWLLERD